MPFYEYECQSCKYYAEVLQKITDAPLRKCPSCGRQTLTKLISAPVFRLKGSGWYETDFKSDKEDKRNLAGAEREEAKPAEAAKTEPASPAKAAPETKPEAKAPPAQVSSESKRRPAPSTRRGAAAAGTRPSPRARGKPAPAKKGAAKRRTKR